MLRAGSSNGLTSPDILRGQVPQLVNSSFSHELADAASPPHELGPKTYTFTAFLLYCDWHQSVSTLNLDTGGVYSFYGDARTASVEVIHDDFTAMGRCH
jgi:hypothetical protein